MKRFIETHFSLVLLGSVFLGLAVPGLEHVPSWVVIGILACILFLACFKIRWEEIRRVHWARFGAFYAARYVAFPILLYFAFRLVSVRFAPAAFLLALLPAGVTSPAFAGLFGGSVSLAIVILSLTTLLVPLLLPAMVAAILGSSLAIDVKSLLTTLVATVLVPIGLASALRGKARVQALVTHWGNTVSILAVAATVTLVVTRHRELILSQPLQLAVPLALVSLTFVLLYGFGALLPGAANHERVTYAACSGANNLSLGISLAYLYFPTDTSLFLVLGEFPWIGLLVALKKLFEKRIH